MVTIRFRSMIWLVTGVLLAATVMLVFANAWQVDAAPGGTDTTFVSLAAPCRLVDTRPAPDRVGTAAAFSITETKTVQATGTNGNCTIPDDAVGLSLNVTALNATAPSFLTFWPDGTRPVVSSLNPSPGEPPVPNAVNVALSATGTFNIFNLAGSVDVIVDINGYNTKMSLQEINAQLIASEAKIAALEAVPAVTGSYTIAQGSDVIPAFTGLNPERGSVTISCTAGDIASGGGFDSYVAPLPGESGFPDTGSNIVFEESRPISQQAWRFTGRNENPGNNGVFNAYVVCLEVTTP